MIGRRIKSFFKETKLRVLNKVSSWQHKYFSSGGKEVLIKAIAQAIPSYAMSVFKVPVGICEDIQRAVAKFWWGTDRQKSGIHWMKWERMSCAKVRGGLGFRDLSSFNQALVAKQGWRIMQSPDSLVAKVLKARYFKHESFMTARLGSRPSFIWRSVLWGRQVIQKGSRWRIGNGQRVKVYHNNWIPRPSTFRPISAPTMAPDTTVAELIDSEQRWNDKLICNQFRAEDAEAISQLPLPRRPHEDQLIWHYDKRGHYSVKSGYQVAMQLKFPDKPSCSTRPQWNVIWKLSIPEKIKIFLWRAAHDLLPTAGNLWKRRILQESTCQLCCCRTESISHALLECKMAKKVWNAYQISVDSFRKHNHDIIGLLQEVPQQNATIEGSLVAALLWAIWNARNKWLFEGKQEHPTRVVARAESVVESFRKVRQPESIFAASMRAGEQLQWCPPPTDWLKINVDAAVDIKKQVSSFGMVIRDANSKCRAAAIKSSKFAGSVVMAEAAAMEWGLQVASSAGVTNGVFESDSLEVVELVNKKSSTLSEVFWVISEILEKQKTFQNFKAQHVSRKWNGVAHEFAKLALLRNETVMWLDDFPTDIMPILSS